MNEELKKQIDARHDEVRFIKTTDQPVNGLNDQQKVLLNRKANELFNQGKIAEAERIFITTGYSDGLTRVGDKYAEKSEFVKALKLYALAHNQRKIAPVAEKVAQIVSKLILEG